MFTAEVHKISKFKSFWLLGRTSSEIQQGESKGLEKREKGKKEVFYGGIEVKTVQGKPFLLLVSVIFFQT